MSHLLTLSDAIATHARLQPHKVGTHDSRRSLSYATWDDRATRLANALLGLAAPVSANALNEVHFAFNRTYGAIELPPPPNGLPARHHHANRSLRR